MFALVDCNNFYASCERLFQPKLRKVPIVVLSNNDGCVIARSNESKALGIKMGALAYENEVLFKENGVRVFSSNYTLYGDISSRVMATLNEFTPSMEVYSIDEAFLDLSNMAGVDLNLYTQEIKDTVLHNIGIPTCVGAAPSKTLSKSANHFAKKMTANGSFCIDSEEKREMVLRWQPVDDVWGIGRQYAIWLMANNVNTAWELANANKEWIRQKMGVVGVRLVNELNGISCIPIEEVPPSKKEICTSRSFSHNLTDKDEIRQSVATHITRCAEKLRKQGTAAGAIHVFLHTNRFRDLPQYYGALTIPLLTATNLTDELLHYGMIAFERAYKEGYSYKKSGAIVQDIVPANQIQQSLFSNNPNREKGAAIMKALDGINGRMGKDTIRYGAAGYSKKWRLRADMISPRYTTNLNEILKVKI
ncbi:Y-family DNA polymerase [Taibaiella lutea]|uniref:Y-family DNA polymerase n=1 Tax=Taibaiella lutea TaxID=2608001 RepID=A0A5M6CBQ0_9BACT|nr:Y-family DNA polymerase [Taibaiella lutea]KAA5532628.1 Y-family DNA polymerase [Taibaiella lutea]